MSEKLPGRDLQNLVTQMEKDWQELRELLRANRREAEGGSAPVAPQQGHQPWNSGRKTGVMEEIPGSSLPEDEAEIKKLNPRAAVTLVEAEAIVQGVEKVHRDAEILERLARVEKQNRRIAVLGSMFLTMLALSLGVVAFLMLQSPLLNKVGWLSAVPGFGQPQAAVSGSLEKKGAATEPEAQAPVVYVGSKTSNKYHYPDCQWAKTIAPERLITFKSVEEAQKAGYKPCPVCKPPTTE